jgi:two-component system sensor histidine kinase BarA
LFVDDNEVNRMLGVTLLEEAGYAVETVEDGIGAVEAAKRGVFGAIFMDVRMPNMGGLEATQAIRRLPNGAGAVPIIGLSANAMAGDREAYLGTGLNDYLTKPLDAKEFLSAALRWTHWADATRIRNAAPVAPQSEFDAIPLLDGVVLDRLRHMMPRPNFHAFINKYLNTDFLVGIEEDSGGRSFAELEDLVHDCKGTSSNLGASRLRAIAERFELACRASDASAISRLMPELRRVTNLTHIALRALA